MKKKEKKMILGLVLGVVILIVILLIGRNVGKKETTTEGNTQNEEKYVKVLEDGTKLNTSNKLSETKEIDGLEIGNIQFTYNNGISVVLADVVNTTSKDIEITEVVLTLYDDKNNVLEELEGVISPVKAGESVQLNMGVSADYANAYDFSLVIKK